jgi:hypothetical protein
MKRKFSRTSSFHVPAPATITTWKPLADMTPEEGRMWIEGMRTRLIVKQRREQAYLDRRATRGTHTPTDEAYEADQVLEQELLALLDELLQGLTR